MPLGMMAAGAIGPGLTRRLGLFGVAVLSLSVTALCLVAIKLSAVHLTLWFGLRFLIGLAIACVFIVTDVWINGLVSPEYRGRVLGAYATAMSVGFAIGPLALALTGSEGWTPFLLGCVLVAIAVLGLCSVRKRLPVDRPAEPKAGGRQSFLRRAPVLLYFVAVVALVEQTTFAFFHIWADNLLEREASLLLSIMAFGSIVLAYPVGWLVDRMGSRVTVFVCAVTSATAAYLLALVSTQTLALAITMFLFGGAYYGIYIAALALLGSRYSGALLVAGAAAFGAFWGLGGLVGPLVAGALTDVFGRHAFPPLLGTSLVTVALLALLRRNHVVGGSDSGEASKPTQAAS